MPDFIHFKDIIPSLPETWQGKSLISFDLDWAHDLVIEDTINLIEEANIKACFFVTHHTPLLLRLRANYLFELGLHPNFDSLVNGEKKQTAREIIMDLSRIVPEAKVLRSHAMTTSGRWLEFYQEAGMTHLSNYLMFGDEKIHPFKQLNGLVEAPVYFADDGLLFQRAKSSVTFDFTEKIVTKSNGLRVYNFHPINLFLNTESIDRYSASRPYSGDPLLLEKMRFKGDGTRTWLSTLINQS